MKKNNKELVLPYILKVKEMEAYCKKHNKEVKDLTPEEGDMFIVRSIKEKPVKM